MKRLTSILVGLSLLLTCSIPSYAQPEEFDWLGKGYKLENCVLTFNYIPFGPYSRFNAVLECWEKSIFSPIPPPISYDVGTVIIDREGLLRSEGLIGEFKIIHRGKTLYLCSSCITLEESDAD